ncbi:MAG: hypothetical protein K2X27_02215 [Candidatus Obscuribacterales bacterium]|nr:hypothetical protein [Candidatus Obscuribacterales bacterium]
MKKRLSNDTLSKLGYSSSLKWKFSVIEPLVKRQMEISLQRPLIMCVGSLLALVAMIFIAMNMGNPLTLMSMIVETRHYGGLPAWMWMILFLGTSASKGYEAFKLREQICLNAYELIVRLRAAFEEEVRLQIQGKGNNYTFVFQDSNGKKWNLTATDLPRDEIQFFGNKDDAMLLKTLKGCIAKRLPMEAIFLTDAFGKALLVIVKDRIIWVTNSEPLSVADTAAKLLSKKSA